MNLNIVVTKKPKVEPKRTLADLRIGECGEIVYGLDKHIVIRTYNFFASLTDPSVTWSNIPEIPLTDFFPKGSQITITLN